MDIWPVAITMPNIQLIEQILPGSIKKLDKVGLKLDTPAAFIASLGYQDALANLRKSKSLRRHIQVSFLVEGPYDEIFYLVSRTSVPMDHIDGNMYLVSWSLARLVDLITEDSPATEGYAKMLADMSAVLELAGLKEVFFEHTKSVGSDGITRYRTR